MKTFTYKGPDSGITLQDKETSTDVLLRDGMSVELPEDNAAVKTLVAMGYLKASAAVAAADAATEAESAAPAAPTKKTTK